MLCDYCQRPVAKGKGETRPVFGATGSGGTVYIHKERCPGRPPYRRTYPYSCK